MLIGVHGRLGSGKDTVYERLRVVIPDRTFYRVSFADKLKDSAAALLKIDRDTMESLKRLEDYTSIWVTLPAEDGDQWQEVTRMTMREFLQRYGTESHRDIFGDNFWVDQAMPKLAPHDHDHLEHYVFTDVRFENEAQAILDRGGIVIRVIGADEDTGDHPSERPLPNEMISYTILNDVRDDEFRNLDGQLHALFVSKL